MCRIHPIFVQADLPVRLKAHTPNMAYYSAPGHAIRLPDLPRLARTHALHICKPINLLGGPGCLPACQSTRGTYRLQKVHGPPTNRYSPVCTKGTCPPAEPSTPHPRPRFLCPLSPRHNQYDEPRQQESFAFRSALGEIHFFSLSFVLGSISI